ncbi:hypothetical protein BDV19DRAFT_353973 [Aspergillus venezuelensis]
MSLIRFAQVVRWWLGFLVGRVQGWLQNSGQAQGDRKMTMMMDCRLSRLFYSGARDPRPIGTPSGAAILRRGDAPIRQTLGHQSILILAPSPAKNIQRALTDRRIF